MRRIVAAVAVAFLLTPAHPSREPVRAAAVHPAWQSNLRILIAQLRNDVALTSLAGDTLASAKSALTSDSHLYALLVAYDDLGVCRGMVASAARSKLTRAPRRSPTRWLRRAVTSSVRPASSHGRRRRDDPRALLDASIEARRASPSLVRAALALERARRKVPTPGARA